MAQTFSYDEFVAGGAAPLQAAAAPATRPGRVARRARAETRPPFLTMSTVISAALSWAPTYGYALARLVVNLPPTFHPLVRPKPSHSIGLDWDLATEEPSAASWPLPSRYTPSGGRSSRHVFGNGAFPRRRNSIVLTRRSGSSTSRAQSSSGPCVRGSSEGGEMTDFLDMLGSWLTGRPVPQQPSTSPFSTPDYGVAPSLAPPSQPAASPQPSAQSPTAQVLARLKPPSGQGTGAGATPSYSNPLGLTTPIGGNDLGVALSSLAAVRPGASRFGAFSEGFAGGMAARANAAEENQRLGIEAGKANLENYLKSLQVAQIQRNMSTAQTVGDYLQGGGSQASPSAPSAPSTPPPSPPPSMPPSAGAPPQGSPASPPSSAPASSVSASPLPAATPTAPAAATAATPADSSIPAWGDPKVMAARIERIQNAGDMAMSRGDSALATTLYQRAATEQQRMTATINSQKTFTNAGVEIPLPGAIATDAAMAQAKASAEQAGKNEQAELSSPSGAKYLPPPIGYQPPPPGSEPPRDPPPGATIGGTPSAMQTDPETANVTTSIPAAPRGGGYPVPDIPTGARLTKPGDATIEQAKSDQTGFGDIVGKMPQIDQSIQRYQTLANAFQRFPSGYGQEALTFYAGLASQYGHPDLAKTILGGDPAAAQVASKESLNLALDTIKAAQPRFAQSEFNKLADKGTPNSDLAPSANHQLIAEGLGIQLRNKAFITDWQKAQQNGWQSPSAFYTRWSQANPMSGFVNAAQHQIGNFKGMDLPPASEWKAGVTYVAPNDMSPEQTAAFAKRGIQPGQSFKFNGSRAAQALQPIGAGG